MTFAQGRGYLPRAPGHRVGAIGTARGTRQAENGARTVRQVDLLSFIALQCARLALAEQVLPGQARFIAPAVRSLTTGNGRRKVGRETMAREPDMRQVSMGRQDVTGPRSNPGGM